MFKLASSLGLALAVADLKRRISHWVRSGAFAGIGAVFAIIALCFLLVALHLFLSGVLNPVASASIIGVLLLLIAFVFFYAASRPLASRAAAAPAEPVSQMGDALRDGMARLGQAAGSSGSPLRSPVFQAALFALVAGIVFGRRSKRDKREDSDDD